MGCGASIRVYASEFLLPHEKIEPYHFRGSSENSLWKATRNASDLYHIYSYHHEISPNATIGHVELRYMLDQEECHRHLFDYSLGTSAQILINIWSEFHQYILKKFMFRHV